MRDDRSPRDDAGSRGEALRSALRAPGTSIGLWAALPSAFTAGLAAAAGSDYVVVDEQHGAVGPAELLSMLDAIAAAGRPPLVRVGRNDPWAIGRALDLGADGVIVPLVESADEAAAAVAACRYAPKGIRSYGALRGGPDPAPVCFVMIETTRGLDALDAIVRTPGLDGVYVGPSDLALSFGLAPTREIEHPPVLDAIAAVRDAARRAGVLVGVHCLTPPDAARWAGEGLDLVTAGADLAHLRTALEGAMATARGD
jgi:4-hydroxy-2-oxoheptanedioate aldolase